MSNLCTIYNIMNHNVAHLFAVCISTELSLSYNVFRRVSLSPFSILLSRACILSCCRHPCCAPPAIPQPPSHHPVPLFPHFPTVCAGCCSLNFLYEVNCKCPCSYIPGPRFCFCCFAPASLQFHCAQNKMKAGSNRQRRWSGKCRKMRGKWWQQQQQQLRGKKLLSNAISQLATS